MRSLVLAFLLLLALSDCDRPASRSLWLSYLGREVDLVLVDHEPPPF